MIPNGQSYYVLRIKDIERNKYCFTDGVGKISWGLAGRIAQKMNIPLTNRVRLENSNFMFILFYFRRIFHQHIKSV